MNRECVYGGVLGLAVGDALGVPAEFMSREALRREPVTAMHGGGTHGQSAGTWSDDTSMTVCLMESLIQGVNYDDQMGRFTDWMMNGAYSAHDELFDIGGATKSAIFKYAHGFPALECGGLAENSCGNGSLMRILPVILYIAGKAGKDGEYDCLNDETAGFLHDVSRLTHAHPLCLMACGIYASVVFELCRCNGAELNTACKEGIRRALTYYAAQNEFTEQRALFNRLERIEEYPESSIESSGYVLHTLEAALWCLLNTSTYKDCVLRAVNLGSDTDTTAAVAGSLAGIWYGYDAIPKEWLSHLAKVDYLKNCCKRFADATSLT